MTRDNRRRPATLLPPPLVYVAALWAAWELHKLSGLGFPKLPGIGWLLVGLGGVLMLWAAWTMFRHRTTVNPYKGVEHLVQSGPFAFSRNPIYLADSLVYFGVMLIWGSLWPLLLYPVVWAAMRYGVIRNEEAHLDARFGEAYEEYCRRVRRWI
ncbi:isoprenylcysteine carboxylmethyltransferase family protein [Betaproteobacteria bacterium SCN2]|jgi:protein-S-isoprenylcysteine O-methyltransferase Ste14|nr:isoprenylcysteine carboxylmethyltransferase family protein [Betaproteobacteria bacterium SCN2]